MKKPHPLGEKTVRRVLKAWLDALPEYTAAHFGLGVLYRRQRKTDLAIRQMLDAIRFPK